MIPWASGPPAAALRRGARTVAAATPRCQRAFAPTTSRAAGLDSGISPRASRARFHFQWCLTITSNVGNHEHHCSGLLVPGGLCRPVLLHLRHRELRRRLGRAAHSPRGRADQHGQRRGRRPRPRRHRRVVYALHRDGGIEAGSRDRLLAVGDGRFARRRRGGQCAGAGVRRPGPRAPRAHRGCGCGAGNGRRRHALPGHVRPEDHRLRPLGLRHRRRLCRHCHPHGDGRALAGLPHRGSDRAGRGGW